MINIGGNIGELYVGSTKIAEAYVGNQLVYSDGTPLPYSSKIEYIQNTSGQYINLGSKINSGTDDITVTFMLLQNVAHTCGIFGARASSSSKNFSVIHNALNIYTDVTNSTSSRLTYAGTLNTKYTIYCSRTYKSISSESGNILSESTASGASFTTSTNAYLLHVGNTSYYSSKRVYSLVWRRNGEVFMDLIPVRVGTVGYMYDKVSGELLGNAGSGSFTLGADV